MAMDMEERGLRCATRNFRPRTTRRTRGRWTWGQRRKLPSGETARIKSKPDYFLMRGKDRGRVRRCRWIRPRHHNSDHRALVMQLRARPGGVRRYTDERKRLPVPPPRPMTEGDTMLEELVDTLEAPGKRDRPDHEWIRGGTWALIDERASRRKQGTLTQAQGRRLSRRIRQALKQDRRERARKAGEEIMGALADGSSKRAYGILRAWHKQCDPAASKPC